MKEVYAVYRIEDIGDFPYIEVFDNKEEAIKVAEEYTKDDIDDWSYSVQEVDYHVSK